MILVNGDSWTGGPTYPNPNFFWSHNLDRPVTNLAHGGVSNQRIFRTTVEFLYSNTVPLTHLIIGWTVLDRFELPHCSHRYLRITAHGCENFIENALEPVPNLQSIRNIYYQHLHSDSLQYQSFKHNLYILQDLCRQRHIRFLWFNSIGAKHALVNEAGYTADSWILPPNYNMELWCDQRGHFRLPSRHTSKDGQLQWAEFVKTYL